ncbi:MAG: arginine deiminase-related protein [Pseudomonadota bacterium]
MTSDQYASGGVSACRFNRAIVRAPAPSAVDGLRAGDGPAPDFAGLRREFEAYLRALRDNGVGVDILPPLEEHPDSIFVEDAALVFPEAAIVLRPGAPSRRGEAGAIVDALRARFAQVAELPVGSVDGGDVLTTKETVFIGLSSRTDREGADALSKLLAELGRKALIVETPPGVLHFKSDCGLIDDETVLATERLAETGAFDDFSVVLTPDGEEAAANVIAINGTVLLSDGFPKTAELLSRKGFRVALSPTREISKLDAGLSCMSLRWRAPD